MNFTCQKCDAFLAEDESRNHLHAFSPKPLEISEREIEGDYRFRETVEEDTFKSCYTRIEDLVGIITSFYSDGRYKTWSELERHVKEFIKNYDE